MIYRYDAFSFTQTYLTTGLFTQIHIFMNTAEETVFSLQIPQQILYSIQHFCLAFPRRITLLPIIP